MAEQTFVTVPAAAPAQPDTVRRTAEDALHLDCPILNKIRAVTVDEGGFATIEWQLRKANGQPIVLCGSVNQIIFRFTDGTGVDSQIVQAIGSVVDSEQGLVQCELPEALVANSGLFLLNIGVTDSLGRVWAQDKGFLSVERGLFGDISNLLGPPTLGELRLVLRDTLLENNLLDDVEYDDSELFFAIVRPVQEWNETPPPVAYFDTRSFPYRDAWINAIVSKLLKTAAVWYERNRLAVSHGGINVDDKNKLNPYLLLAQQFEAQWKQFIVSKKVELNVSMSYGSVGSGY